MDAEANPTGRKQATDFTSFEDIFNSATLELTNAETFESHQRIMESYSDVVSLSDSTYKPKIANRVYRLICNREKIYQIGNRINKVIDDLDIVSTNMENYQALRNINSIDQVTSQDFSIINYSENDLQNSSGRTNGACGQSWAIDYFSNNSGCRNDRRVWISAEAFLLYAGQVSGNNKYYPWVSIRVYGEVRNRLCNWNSYITVLTNRNTYFSVLSYRNTSTNPNFTVSTRVPFGEIIPGRTVEDYSLTLFSGPTGHYLLGEFAGTYNFTQISVEALSRGTEGNWAIVKCLQFIESKGVIEYGRLSKIWRLLFCFTLGYHYSSIRTTEINRIIQSICFELLFHKE
jgi:hypothetical protein